MVATPSVLMFQDTLQNIALTKIAAPENLSQVVRVQDSTTKALNSQITPTGALVIDGTLLKIEGEHLSNSLHFVAQDGTPTLVENNPSKLIVMVPTLQPDQYTLQITTGSSLLLHCY